MSDFPLLPLNEAIDLSNCDREPIHIPGCIQPHGVLFVLQPPDFTIVQVSRNCEQWWPQTAETCLGQNIAAFLTPSDVQLIYHCSRETHLEAFNPLSLTILPSQQAVEARLYRTEGLLVLELEPSLTATLSNPLSFYPLVKRAIATMQTAHNFTTTGDCLVQQVRSITGYDRVMLYRFKPDRSGVVIAEAKRDDLESYLNLHYPASDIPRQAHRLYCQNWLRVIPDIHYQPSEIIPTINPVTHAPLDLSQSILRSVSPIHIEYLQNMGVKATLTISLLHEGALWGLICAHHYQPKPVDGETRKACEFLGQFMSVELFKQQQQDQAQSQEKIAIIQQHLKENLNSESDFIEYILQQKDEDLLDFVAASGLALLLGDRLVLIGQTPPQKEVWYFLQWLCQHYPETVFHSHCLKEVYPKAAQWVEQAVGALGITVAVKQIVYQMVWFRPEELQRVTWGGNPQKPVTVTIEGEVRLSPRKSFAAWQETVKHQSLPWTHLEIEAVSQLLNTLMMASLTFAQAALEETTKQANVANRLKSEFLANMSHEIRTPMNAILGFCDLLQDVVVESHQKQYLEAIATSGESLLRLIDDILDLSKIEAGKLALKYEPVYVRQILLEIQQIFTQKAQSRGLVLKLEIDSLLDWGIEFEEMRLRQILLNLVGNALKFTEQGQVTIAAIAQPYDDNRQLWLKISVKDTGIGISREQQQHIFDAFVQSEGQSTRKYGGTGVGLTITRRLTEMLGGIVFLRSQLQQGSEFSLIFPEIKVLARSRHSIAPATPTIALQQFAPAKILVVDDAQSNLDVVAGYFYDTEHQLLFARDGCEAMDMAIAHRPDLILMDLFMPRLDGEAASLQLKLNPKTQSIPIVLLTASITPETRLHSQHNHEAFLRKPFSQHQLAVVLQKFLPYQNEPSPAIVISTTVNEVYTCAPEILTALDQIQQTLWPEVQQNLTRRKVTTFLNRLQGLLHHKSCPGLEEYIQRLNTQLLAFDWQNLPQTVEAFPQLCQTLQNPE
jgi:chemotaxis family two-component system sensor kinase Cph1